MKARQIEPAALVDALNSGPGEPHEDVRSAAESFDVNERTVYRRITEYGISRDYRWVVEDEQAEAA
jgi:transcriptional regulator of acetoin/glycerol metabolism